MIIDSHAHVVLPTEKQISLMDEAGVERTVLFSTTVHPERCTDMRSLGEEMSVLGEILAGVRSDRESTASSIEEQVRVIRENPGRFIGFGRVLLGLSEQETGTWINGMIIQNGLRGLGEFTLPPGKTHLLEMVFSLSMDFGKLPLWIHAFSPLGAEDIAAIDRMSRRYPGIPVILGHLGGVFWQDAVKLAKENGNLYLDLSAAFTTMAPAFAIRELPDRTLLSSDAPYGDPFLARQMVERVTPDAGVRKQVLGETMARLLDL